MPPYRILNNSTFSPSLICETSEFFHRLVAINYYDPEVSGLTSLMPHVTQRSPQVRAYSLPAGRQASSDSCGIYSMKFIGQEHCKDVLAYPLHVASVYRFCSSVPDFVVSLPSVLTSQQTTLRLTNRLHQLACERLSLSGIFGILPYLRSCWAHTLAC